MIFPRARKRPLIGITLGDPAGIGPEVVLRALTSRKIYQHCRPLVIGDAQFLSLRNYRAGLKIRPVLNPLQGHYQFGTVDILHLPETEFLKIEMGRATLESGKSSALSVKKSVELALLKLVDGIVHAPISKLAWKMAKVPYPGHTEMLADLCKVKEVAMAIVSEPLRTVLVTRHLPFKEVPKTLNAASIVMTIRLARKWLQGRGIANPKIGVCALNPHAGENGLLGDEEIQKIQPAIAKTKKIGWRIFGPLPADSAFRDHQKKIYDCLITMYHDQSLIPLKLYHSDGLVNITLGLPFPRTSPGHGTGYDLAGKNRANPKPMREAILTCAKLCLT